MNDYVITTQREKDLMKVPTERFVEVRNRLFELQDKTAYRRCFKKMWGFYRHHTIEEAIQVITGECTPPTTPTPTSRLIPCNSRGGAKLANRMENEKCIFISTW